jgi:hypothetical protein
MKEKLDPPEVRADEDEEVEYVRDGADVTFPPSKDRKPALPAPKVLPPQGVRMEDW